MCLGLKRKGSGSRVFTLFSDGELDEGSKWEAMMSAAHYKLDNLIAIIDVNNQQADGPSKQMMGFEPLAEKIQAFGWFVQRINGNDLDAVVAAFDAAQKHEGARPRMIIADTVMGKGVPFLEARERNHFMRVEQAEWQLALRALEDGRSA
jgi:transketolase